MQKIVYLWPSSSKMSRYFDEYYFELTSQEKIQIKELNNIFPIPKILFNKLINYKLFRKYVLRNYLKNKNHLIHFTSQLNVFTDITQNFIFTFHDVLHLNTGMSGTFYSNEISNNIINAVKFSKNIITISNCSKEKILLYYQCDPKKILVVSNGINIKNKINNKKRNNSILFVGSNAPRKNIINLLEAVKYYQINYDSSVQLKLVSQLGSFGQLDTYSRIIDHLKIQNLFLFENINIEKLNSLYENEGVLVYPTFEEGFGLPPIEAQSFGMSVVASDIPIMHEILNDSVLFCNPNSHKDIAEKINIILSDNKSSKQFEEKGFKNHINYNINNSVRKTCDIYENLLND